MDIFYARLLTFLTSALPVIELRGGIPLGRSLGMPTWETFLLGILGSIAPVIFLLWLLAPLTAFFRKHWRFFDTVCERLFEKTRQKHSKNFERLGAFALITFVAIPLPGTGAWTGSLLAFLFGIPYWTALILISLGVIGAGLLMTAGVSSVIHLINLF